METTPPTLQHMPAYASICQHKGSTAAIEPSQIPIRSPLFRFLGPTSSNISSKIPKIAPKTSNMAPRWPPRAPRMASKTPNLGLQSSKMPSATCQNPRKLRYELHLLMMPTILTHISLDQPQASDRDRNQSLQNGPRWPQLGPKMAQNSPKMTPTWPKMASK